MSARDQDRSDVRDFVVIVLGTTLIACLLGIAVDLVTAHVAVDYFLEHHPRIIESERAWALAIAWGIGAAWWAGAISGVLLAALNYRLGSPLRPWLILAWVAVASGVLWAAMMSIVGGIMFITSRFPTDVRSATFEYDRRLVAVAMAHQYEYLMAVIGLAIVAAMVWWRGQRVTKAESARRV